MITMNIKIHESNLLKALDKQKIWRVSTLVHKMHALGMILRPGGIQLIISYLFSQHSYEIEKARCIFLLENNKTGI